MTSRVRFFTLAGLLVLALAAAPAAQAAEEKANVTVVHAFPGLTVDVYVNGDLAIPGFVPETITPPLAFDPGTYDIVIVPEGGDPATPAISGSATVAAGDDVSLVAHLAADGTPTLSAFANNLALGDRGEGRLMVRHVAAAPAVDVRLKRRIWRFRFDAGSFDNVSNGNGGMTDVHAGRYEASIFPAGGNNSVAGPAPIRVRKDRATIVYAIGDLAGGTFALISNERELRSETATATIIHGVLGLTVDVYVNGTLILPGFEPRTITDSLPLPCGDYNIVIVPEGGDPASPAIEADVTLESDTNYSIVAHLAADGTPTASVFENDTSTAGWRGRFVVRHTAAAPAVDARLTRVWRFWRWHAGVLADIVNGQEAGTAIAPGNFIARVTPAGQPNTTVLGPAPVKVPSRTAVIVYAIGSLADGTLDLLVQSYRLR